MGRVERVERVRERMGSLGVDALLFSVYDFVGTVDGYCSDTTRAVFEGRWGARIDHIVVANEAGPDALNTVSHDLAVVA